LFLRLLFLLTTLLISNHIHAEVDPAHIVLHSISNDDELAVLSWAAQDMVTVAPQDEIGSRYRVLDISSSRVILSDSLNGDKYLLSKSGMTLLTQQRPETTNPNPIEPVL
jgi:hypothetical protein